MVGLAEFVAVFHDACCFTVHYDAILSDGDLVNAGGFCE
jgi:hypothetical protein